MTTAINNTTPILSILAALASSDATYQNAAESFADAITEARAAGIKSGDLEGKPKGKYYVELQTAVAMARLNPTDLALWSDPKEKAPAKSTKNALQMRINSATKRIRDRLAGLEAAAMAQIIAPDAAKPDAVKRGSKAGAVKTSFADLCVNELQAAFSRMHKDNWGDAPQAVDHAAFFGHLQAAADIFGKTLKVPERPTKK